MSLIVEIRAAEGGDDAKLLVEEQLAIYVRLCTRNSIEVEVTEQRSGFCVFRASGKGVEKLFQNESGGHRWQRVPPNEKKGRVHTSTITVAVLSEPEKTQVVLREEDLEESACRGSGAGGQHRNVTASAVQLKHKPSGIMVRCESERSQAQNRSTARAILRAKLWELRNTQQSEDRSKNRKDQVGSGMRGDKRRTIRTQDDQVTDHLTGRVWRYKDYHRGIWNS